MDVIIFCNGLGNQMSQYAFYLNKKSITKDIYNLDFCIDHNGAELNKVFKIGFEKKLYHNFLYIIFRILVTEKVKIIFKPLQLLFRFFNCKIIKENFDYTFNKDYLVPSKGITFYFGGWPSEKYFLTDKSSISNSFNFSIPNDLENTNHINRINTCNSVAIHVRRGDYLMGINLELFGRVCTKEYFKKAIGFIEHNVENPHFFVFSNDIEWVQLNLQMHNVTYVTCNCGENSWMDMYLMSICKHNIISNSTFSWWGAWLNTNPNKIVISPSRYLNDDNGLTDVYPESWIKLT